MGTTIILPVELEDLSISCVWGLRVDLNEGDTNYRRYGKFDPLTFHLCWCPHSLSRSHLPHQTSSPTPPDRFS